MHIPQEVCRIDTGILDLVNWTQTEAAMSNSKRIGSCFTSVQRHRSFQVGKPPMPGMVSFCPGSTPKWSEPFPETDQDRLLPVLCLHRMEHGLNKAGSGNRVQSTYAHALSAKEHPALEFHWTKQVPAKETPS